MISSGIVISTIGLNSDEPVDPNDSGVGGEINTVQRVVLMEDFTNEGCMPCAIFNPKWTHAIENRSDVTAPAYVHVHWPSRFDDWNNYGDMQTQADNRRSMFGVRGVPSAWMDGISTSTGQTQAYYEARIDTFAAVPANVQMTSSGYINPTTRFGTISVHAEAVENLPPGDYRLVVYIWENGVTRYQPYPNGEAEMDWAVWLMLPDEKGESIWTGGATIGDYVDIDRSFTCGSDWDLSEMGATVFVQNFDTFFVEQAHEENFASGSQPTNDLAVFGDNVQVSYDMGESTSIDFTVFNAGTSDETNVEVNLTLDGIVQDSQIIPSILSDTDQSLNFLWSAPSTAGVYKLGIEVTPVSGETILGNNKWDTFIEVFAWPEITATPASFDVTVNAGAVGFDTLTINNSGDANLDFGVGFETQLETFSQTQWSLRSSQMDYGNVYNVTTTTTLYEINQYLNAGSNNEMIFFVYEGTGILGTYNKIAEKYIAKSGTGEGFYSSGYMNVELLAGNFYYIGGAWNGNSTEYYRCSTTNQPKHSATSFGFVECGTLRQTGWPPSPMINNAYDLYVNYQSITTGSEPPSWLSVVPDSGTVGTSSQTDSTLTFDASSLTPGLYHTDMTIFSNDRDETQILTPVDLNVTPGSTPFSLSVEAGWNFISTTFIPLDTSVPDVLLDVDADTTWTMLQYYDVTDTTDHWKTYASFMPSSKNDLSDLDETMGVWAYIPAGSLGDGIINVSGTPPLPDPVISLKAGWNMVGYPSLNSQLASSANLPAAVTDISVLDLGEPYHIRDTTDFSTVVLSAGNAYWMYASSDALWTIPTPDNAPVSQGTYSGPSPTGINPVTIDWTATDDLGLTQVELFYQHNGGGYVSWIDGTNPVAASGTSDSGVWSFDFPDGNGAYDLYTIATDNNPQVENAPVTPDVTIDYAFTDNPPTSQVTYAGASPTNMTPATLDWTADDDVGLDQIELFYRFDGGPLSSWSDASNPAPASGIADSGNWAFDFPDGYGTYDLLSIARDTLMQLEVKVIPDITITYQENPGTWWNTNWVNRKKLTFDNLGQTEELIDFPVLVKLNSMNFDYSKAKADGTDLRFIDVDGSTELNYHIELWDILADSYVWVNVTQIDASSSSDYIWMYYNYTGAADTQNVEMTYNGDYVGVWHLNETTGPHYDSTSYGQAGTANIDGAGSQDSIGMMGGADYFDGIDDYVEFTDTTTHDTDLEQLTLEAWFYGDLPSSDLHSIVSKWHRFGVTADSYRLAYAFNNFGFDVQESGDARASVSGGSLSSDTWYYAAGTWNNTKAVLYIDGNEVNSLDLSGTNVDDTSNGLAIARINSNENYYYFDGIVDEVRLSKASRSADWIKAQFLSMKDLFITFDPEETQTRSTIDILGVGPYPPILSEEEYFVTSGHDDGDMKGFWTMLWDMLHLEGPSPVVHNHAGSILKPVDRSEVRRSYPAQSSEFEIRYIEDT